MVTGGGPSNRSLLIITVLTLALLLVINISPISPPDSTRIRLATMVTQSTTPVTMVTQSTTPVTKVTEDGKELYLHPPPQEWVQAQVEKALAVLGLQYSPPNKWTQCEHDRQTYYFPTIRTVFTGIPKSGCSNWLEALLRAEGTLDHELERTEVFKVHGSLSQPHRMTTINKKEADPEIKDDFSFTVLRNPWTRMVSGYRDKLSAEVTQGFGKRNLGMDIVREMRGIEEHEELKVLYPTFEEYLRYLVAHNTTDNVHFTQQHRVLCLPQSRYAYIVPLEYSTVMSSDIWSHINTTVSIALLGSYDSATDPRLQTSTRDARAWFMDIDQGVVDSLYELYRGDFVLLNYTNFTHTDFPLPLYRDS